MTESDPIVRGGVVGIALMLGVALSAAIYAGHFRSKGPHDPDSFHLVLEESHRYSEPSNVAVSINIDPSGNFTVIDAAACSAQPDLERQVWVSQCKQQVVRQGSVHRQDVIALRDHVRSRGFYRWRPIHKNAFGNNDTVRVCIVENEKRKCVRVQTSLYFAFKSGPEEFWDLREDIYRLTSTPARWGKGASNQAS
jgi:hypothetical protein